MKISIIRFFIAACVVAAACAALGSSADEHNPHGPLWRLIDSSDAIIAAEIVEEPHGVQEEIGVTVWSLRLRPLHVFKGDPERPGLYEFASMNRAESPDREPGDRLPFMSKGAKVILFLRRAGAAPLWTSADMWFSIQPDRTALRKAIEYRIEMTRTAKDDAPAAQDLSSPDNDTRWNTAADALRFRDALVKEAIAVLRHARAHGTGGPIFTLGDPRKPAVRVLDRYRAPEGIPELLFMIDVRTDLVVLENREVTLGDHYPAAGALAAIGQPSIRLVLWELGKEQEAGTRERLAWVIGAIADPTAARCIFHEAIDKETDPERRGRLMEALLDLDRLFPIVVNEAG